MRQLDETDAAPPWPVGRRAMVERLCGHFAHSALTAPELERGLDLAYSGTGRSEGSRTRGIGDGGSGDTTVPQPARQS